MKDDREGLSWQQSVEYRKVRSFGLDFNREQRARKIFKQRLKPYAERLVESC